MPPVWSRELEQIREESRKVARESGQAYTSAHLLLGLFLVKNRAVLFFEELGVTFELLLQHVNRRPAEPERFIERIDRRAVDVATTNRSDTINSLHLLVSIASFPGSAACALMRSIELDIEALRDAAFAEMEAQSRVAQPSRSPAVRRQANEPSTHEGAPDRDLLGTAPSSRAPDPTTPPAAVAAGVVGREEPLARAPSAPLGERLRARTPVTGTGRTQGVPSSAPRTLPPGGAPAEVARVRSTVASAAQSFLLREDQFPTLTRLGRNLTWLAAQGRIDPVHGRNEEIRRVVDILLKRRANNPVLVGEPGVGKTAVAEGLARVLAGVDEHDAGPALQGRILIELEASRLFSGAQARGTVAERIQRLRQEVLQARGRIILFLDELHVWVGSSGEDRGDGTSELKTALARGEFPCIGATTASEYARYIETDAAFARRFDVVRVDEPSADQAIAIVRGSIAAWEEHHHVGFDDDALEAAVRLTLRFVPDRRLPDKAFQALDLAGSRARRLQQPRVDRALVTHVVAEHAGLPEDRLTMSDADRFLRLDEALRARVVGHQTAVDRVASTLRRNYAGFLGQRPVGSFLFLGPTGVGKTEFARALADAVYGARDAMVRIDMSEFHESHAMMRLIGSPPGYVGHESGGQLTEAIARRPWQLVLFDEVEKAHPDVLNLLLQVLEDGRLTDGRGKTVDFRHTVVLLTSNLGADGWTASSHRRAGFARSADAEDGASAEERVRSLARAAIRPEVWNRLDDILVFHPLSREEVHRVAHLLLRDSSDRLLSQRSISYACDPAVVDWLIERGGYDESLGARPMRRAIESQIESVIADAILRGEVPPGASLLIECIDDRLHLRDYRPAGAAEDSSAG
jgi:ATP-dependent Clp protease ATP-binding subunit ClpC